MPNSLSAAFSGSTQERRAFHRFVVCTVPAFTGASESGFWGSLVLKVGQEDSVIRNAIIALSTLHEDYQERGGKYDPRIIKQQGHQHAVQLYTQSLHQVQERLSDNTRSNVTLAIISSILFVCFEVLQRNNMNAVLHYQAGMRETIRQMKLQEDANISPPTASTAMIRQIPQSDLDELLRVFARYDIQACTFSKPQAERLETELPLVPPTNLTLDQVRRHLDNLLIAVYQMVGSDLGMYRYRDTSEVPVEWLRRRDEGVQTFETWLDALGSFLDAAESTLTPMDLKVLLGLRLQIRVAIMMLKTCIDCKAEMNFDCFRPDFDDMVSRVERMTQKLLLKEGKPLDIETTPFTMELGVIHPLFFVATKCRDWALRRRAITQLKKGGKEGVWEGPIMAVVAERLMQIEERDVPWGASIPELNRIHKIVKNVNYDGRQVFVDAQRSLDGTFTKWETLQQVVNF